MARPVGRPYRHREQAAHALGDRSGHIEAWIGGDVVESHDQTPLHRRIEAAADGGQVHRFAQAGQPLARERDVEGLGRAGEVARRRGRPRHGTGKVRLAVQGERGVSQNRGEFCRLRRHFLVRRHRRAG